MMSKQDTPFESETANDASADERLAWSKPTVKTNSVVQRTTGGTYTIQSVGDDEWYAS